MPDALTSANTEALAVAEYGAQSGTDAIDEKTPPPKTSPPTEAPEVGLAQRGERECAVVRRETDV